MTVIKNNRNYNNNNNNHITTLEDIAIDYMK
jgi:hypothetical protein